MNVITVDKIVTIKEELEVEYATLLSIGEVKTLLGKEERKYTNWWWMRSPGNHSNYTAYVLNDGSVNAYGRGVSYDNGVIRPALRISNIESSNLKIGDRFEFANKTFKIISENLAFCEGDIGHGPFRGDWLAEDASIYEVSDVKQIVDKWFNRLIGANND